MWTVKAINDDQATCEICGKEDLKRVVWLENSETQEIIAAGTTCAAKLQKIKVSEQKKKENDFLKEKRREYLVKKSLLDVEIAKVVRDAPLTFGPDAVSFSERIAWIRNNPVVVECERQLKLLKEEHDNECL